MNVPDLREYLGEITRFIQDTRRRLDDIETQLGAVAGGGAEDFTDLGDTPSDYTGHALKVPRVASGEDGLEFSVVTPAMIEQVATQTLLGRNTADTGSVEVLSALPASIEAAIDHANIQNVGATSHAGIDAHIADADIHFPMPSLETLTDVTISEPDDGEVLTYSNGDWLNAPAAVDVAEQIDVADSKTTPHDNDVAGIVDTEDSNALKQLSWANIKATLQSFFDTVYAAIVHTHDASDVDSGTFDDARIGASNVTQHQGAISHDSLGGLPGGDVHTQYARNAGRAGGQHLRGGTGSGDDLTLESTSHGTKGSVRVLDAAAVGGDFSPDEVLHILGNVIAKQNTHTQFYAETTSSSSVAGFQMRHPANNWAFRAGQSGDFVVRDLSGGFNPLTIETDAAVNSIYIMGGGWVGFGTNDPLTPHHVALATGNTASTSASGVGGTAVTLLPVGTVSHKLQASGVVVASDGSRSSFALGNTTGSNTQLEPGAGDQAIYNDVTPSPSHVLSLRVTAGGAVRVQRTTGTRTYSVTLTMIWI